MYPPVYGQPRYSTDHAHPSPAAPPVPSENQNLTIPIPPRYSTDGHPSQFPLPSVPYTPTPSMPYSQLSSSMPFPGVAGRWSSRLFHCLDDPAICFITCLCPCITFGQIAEVVSKGSRSCYGSGTLYGLLLMTGFACLYSCSYRSKLRGQHDLAEDPCADCLVHFCCETCALCQEHRELKNRGFDMGIGWEANMDRQKRGITVPPMVAQGMTR